MSVIRGIADSLRSLDLSYNALEDVPFKVFRDLRKLNWLNMHRYVKCNINFNIEEQSMKN